jgi:cholesterol oxidase
MSRFDYDVVVIGSGFGGSVAALRGAEKGYRVGVMES